MYILLLGLMMNDLVKDLSLIGNDLINDEGYKSGVFNNTIKETTAYSAGFERNTPLYYHLGVIMFFCTMIRMMGVCSFYGCFNNSFGVNCHSNTFGDTCSNTFDSDCYNNTFGSDCSNNTFGNNCGNNTFGNQSNYNTFSYYFSYNTLVKAAVLTHLVMTVVITHLVVSVVITHLVMTVILTHSDLLPHYNTFGNYCSYNNFYHGSIWNNNPKKLY